MREAEEDWGRLNETGRNLRLAACAPCWFLSCYRVQAFMKA